MDVTSHTADATYVGIDKDDVPNDVIASAPGCVVHEWDVPCVDTYSRGQSFSNDNGTSSDHSDTLDEVKQGASRTLNPDWHL
jgi:hypothetical protein